MNRPAAITMLSAGAIALGGAGVLAAPAGAALLPSITLTNPQACFVNTFSPTASGDDLTENSASVHVTGAGWHPGAQVQLDFDGITDEVQTTASPSGTFSTSFQLPDPALGYGSSLTYGSLPIVAVDFGDGNLTDLGGSIAITPKLDFTTREVSVWEDQDDVYGPNSVFHPTDPVEFKASGFTPGQPVYAHYLRTGATAAGVGRLISTVNLGTAQGPCGTVNHRASIMAFTPPASERGDYTIHYSSTRAYTPGGSQFSWPFKL